MSEEPGRYKPSALELLTDKEGRDRSFLANKWAPLAAGFIGFVSALVINWQAKRPAFSGIQRHGLYTVVGMIIGKLGDDYKEGYYMERDAILKHYVELHPDDFHRERRIKFGEILEEWVPVR